MMTETELDSVVDELLSIQKAAIDASSIVYLRKARAFDTIRSQIQLSTIKAVVAETGFDDLSIEIVSIDIPDATTDDTLLEYAVGENIPLISEDKKLLLKAERMDVSYYNAMMMLCLSATRECVSLSEQERIFDTLAHIAHYHPRILRFGRALLTHIRKRG